MRQIEQLEQCRLLNFVLNTFIGVIARKGGLTHGVKKVCIKSRRIINFICPADEVGFPGAVIGKIWAYPQCSNILTISQSCLKCDDFFWHR